MKKAKFLCVALLFLICFQGCAGIGTPAETTAADSSDTAEDSSGGNTEQWQINGASTVWMIRADDCSDLLKMTLGDASKGLTRLLGCTVRNLTESEAKKQQDANAIRILFGKLSDPDSVSAYQTLPYGQYDFLFSKNKIIVAGWGDEAMKQASIQLIRFFNEICEEDAVALKNADRKTYVYNQTLSAIPCYPTTDLETVYDCGDNGWMVRFASGRTEYAEYLGKLETLGYSKYTENNLNGNLFATYRNEDGILNVSHYPSVSRTEIILDSAKNTALPTVRTSAATPICETSMAQLRFVYDNDLVRGMGYVFQTTSGKFIIIDGGFPQNVLSEDLYRYLYEHAPDPEHIVVAEWIFTHGHGDHLGILETFAKSHADTVAVEQFAFNRPSEAYHAVLNEGVWASAYTAIHQYYPNAEIVKLHAGQTFRIDNIAIDIFFTIELYAPETGIYNDSSVVFKVTVDQAVSMLFLGDSSNNVEGIIRGLYGNALKSDFVQLAHHGYLGGGAKSELYLLADPTYVLMPGSMAVYQERKDRAYLKPLVASVPFENWYVADTQTYVFSFQSQGKVAVSTWS